MKTFTLDDLMLGRVSARLGSDPAGVEADEREKEDEREIVFSYPLGYKKKKKESKQQQQQQQQRDEEIVDVDEGAQNILRKDEQEEKMASIIQQQQREAQMRMQRELKEEMAKMVEGLSYAEKQQDEHHHQHQHQHQQHQQQQQQQQRASPRRAEENERTQQLEQHQNVLTSPPRRITLQPSPLKASNQRPEASPGMRALGLSPSPVKQIHNGNNDKNRKQQQTDEDETMKETLEYRGGYLDAHPKLEKPPSPPRGFFRKIDSVASDEKQRQQQKEQGEAHVEPRGAHRRKSPSGGIRASESTMTIDLPSKHNGTRKGRRESEELRLEASKILGITPPQSQKYGGHHPRAIVATLVSNNQSQYRLDGSSDFEEHNGRRRSSRANKNLPARPYWETNTPRYEDKRKLRQQDQTFDMVGDGSNDSWIGGLTDERTEKMHHKRAAYANGSASGQQPPRKKKRGRPPGTKNPPNAKKTGPKTKKTLSANNSDDDDDVDYRFSEEKPKKKRGRPVGWRKYPQQATQQQQRQRQHENYQRRRYEGENDDEEYSDAERSLPASAPPSDQKRSSPPQLSQQVPPQLQQPMVVQTLSVVPSLQPPLVDNPTAAPDEKTCLQCKRSDHDYALLVCGGCKKCFHTFCLVPQVSKIPDGDWFCYDCVANGRSAVKREGDNDEAPGSTDAKTKKKEDPKDPEGEEVKVKKKPGPKPGSKRRPDAKKPGPKPRRRVRHRAYSSDEDSSSLDEDEDEAVGWTRGGRRVVQGKTVPSELEKEQRTEVEEDIAINNSKTAWTFNELVALENAAATVKKDENYWQNIAKRIPTGQNCAPKTAKECRQRVYEGMPSDTR